MRRAPSKYLPESDSCAFNREEPAVPASESKSTGRPTTLPRPSYISVMINISMSKEQVVTLAKRTKDWTMWPGDKLHFVKHGGIMPDSEYIVVSHYDQHGRVVTENDGGLFGMYSDGTPIEFTSNE